MITDIARKNILNGNNITINTNCGSYIFSYTSSNVCEKNITYCIGCKIKKWSILTLYKDKLCKKCFKNECCTFCRIWCGELVCEDCEDFT